MIGQIIFFVLVSIFAVVIMVRNTNKWAIKLNRYMFRESNKIFQDDNGWGGGFGLILSKVMIIFLGLMFILAVYVAAFTS